MSNYVTGLVGIDNTQDATLSTILLDNFVTFFDWGFLDKGGFNTITIPNSGMYGGQKTDLRPAIDPNYPAYAVWQTFRQNWAWESGISKTTQPVHISGIYVNNTFIPYTYNPASGSYIGGTGPSGYRLDFIDGRVVFNQPIPSGSTVRMNYSSKWIKVDKAEGIPFFRQIQSNDFKIDNNFLNGSGEWIQLGQTRIQLPAVFIEVVPNRTYTPFQLGGGQWANTDIVFYTMSDRESDCANILNMISYQNDRVIPLFDTNMISRSGAYPINFKGGLVDPQFTYPKWVNNYYYNKCRIYDTVINNISQVSVDFYLGTARCSTQVELLNIT